MTPGDVKTARTTWDNTRAAAVQPATRAACAVHAACAAQLGGDVLLDHGRDSVPQRLSRRGAYRPDRHRRHVRARTAPGCDLVHVRAVHVGDRLALEAPADRRAVHGGGRRDARGVPGARGAGACLRRCLPRVPAGDAVPGTHARELREVRAHRRPPHALVEAADQIGRAHV